MGSKSKENQELLTSFAPADAGAAARSGSVLFVDLDGTLIKSDLLWETALQALRHRPMALAQAPRWLLRGRSCLKESLAAVVPLDIRRLPFHEKVLDFVRERSAQGDQVVLATAAHSSHAQQVASELGIFDAVLASDGTRNLKGAAKLAAIEQYCAEHGFNTFSYIGDSSSDLAVWRRASIAYLVEPSSSLECAVRKLEVPATILSVRESRVRYVLRALRPKQWIKNLLIFVPLITAHEVLNFEKLVLALLAFLTFCGCASAAYVLNDLLDLHEDRVHPIKQLRPFAAGNVPIAWGFPLFVALVATSFAVALGFLPLPFTVALCVYLATTTIYSQRLKNVLVADVLVLAGIYALRVFAGGLATSIEVSSWLMAFSLFLFTSLAFSKRYAELQRLASEGVASTPGRAYRVVDMRLIESAGPASGYVAVLVLALYVNADTTRSLYHHTWALWLLCPLMLSWITRNWFLAVRGELPEDPVLFAARDKASWVVFACACVVLVIGAWN